MDSFFFLIKSRHVVKCIVLTYSLQCILTILYIHVNTTQNKIKNNSLIPECPMVCSASCFMPQISEPWEMFLFPAALPPALHRADALALLVRAAWMPQRVFSQLSCPASHFRKLAFLHLCLRQDFPQQSCLTSNLLCTTWALSKDCEKVWWVDASSVYA